MNEKKVLGKGLAALISENVSFNDEVQANGQMQFIEIDRIVPNAFQPRSVFSEDELRELASSIKEFGVLQPIIVRIKNNNFQIVAGERRYQASKKLGLNKIPAIIKDLNDRDTFEIALIENIQRENLSPIEEAVAYAKLIEDFNHTHDSLSKILSKSRSYISNTLRLLGLPDEVKKLVIDKKISAGHARTLVNSSNPFEIANKIINDNWTVRRAENEVRRTRENSRGKERYSNLIAEGAYKHFHKDTDLLEIEKILTEDLNTRVQINDTVGGGQIIIDFSSLEQLDLLLDRLAGNRLKF